MARQQRPLSSDDGPETVIAIPTFNEAAHIAAVLAGCLADGGTAPIWVIDGGSTDGTQAIVARFAERHRRVALHDNPGRTQATAINLAARRAAAAGARCLVRLDAHSRYPAQFADRAASRLWAIGADSLVVPLIAEGAPGWQAAAATLQNSWLGHGGAAHRRHGPGGWCDHGHHAAFRLDRFLSIGGYDPQFVANEDAEFDLRLAAAGGRIWLDPALAVAYLPRAHPAALWRQMVRNGWWRMETALKHRRPPGLRQVLPILAALCLTASLLAAIVLHPGAAAPGLGYLGLTLTLALAAAGPRHAVAVACLALVSHLGFATGALARLVRPRRAFRAHTGPVEIR